MTTYNNIEIEETGDFFVKCLWLDICIMYCVLYVKYDIIEVATDMFRVIEAI